MDINITEYLDQVQDKTNKSRWRWSNNEFRKITTARKVYSETPIAECLRRNEDVKFVIDNGDSYAVKSPFSHTLMDEIQKEFGFDKIDSVSIRDSYCWRNHKRGFKTKLKKLQTQRQLPDWLPHTNMNVPSLTTHFRFAQNFSLDILNDYNHRDILGLFYLRDSYLNNIFDGVTIDNGMLIGTLLITEGATGRVTDITLGKEGFSNSRATIRVQKGASFVFNGKSAVTKKEFSIRLPLEKFNEIVCQFNSISL